MSSLVVLCISGAYLALLFAVAFYVDARGTQALGRRATDAWIYTLSIAVYCTSWTFYGSVGRSALDGIGFLPIYIGPVLVFVFGQHLLRKIQRICATHHITSIADFISARYGKSQRLAGLATMIAVIGIVPYISLQLKAVSTSFDLLSHYPAVVPQLSRSGSIWSDSAWYLALLMALFVSVFGTRHVDATEQHRGMVSAIALESLVKLAAFLAVGVYVTYGMFDGVADLFSQAAARSDIAPLLRFSEQASGTNFWMLTALAAIAIVCLPRQFQVVMVECDDEAHLKTARWGFPLYLVAINLFVLPIALAGLLTFGGQGVSPDTFVLALPMANGSPALAMFAFIGGLSAATGMIIVETIALSTMVCNDMVMPLLIGGRLIRADTRIGPLVKGIRRASIVFILMLGYAYVRLVGDSYALVSIGLVSFCAVAQFAPAIVGGVFWRGGSRSGAVVGLVLGFSVWLYTLLLPSFARSGWLPAEFAREGLFYIDALRPYELFGLSGLDPVSHCLLWSMVFNIAGYVLASLGSKPGRSEVGQAQAFVDVFADHALVQARDWRADIRVGQMMALLARFVDPERAQRACAEYAASNQRPLEPHLRADHDFINFSERLLAGAIGAALARVVIASTIREKNMSADSAMEMLSGASQAIETHWEHTREAIENISQGITMFDAEHRLLVWNQRCLDLLSLPAQFAAQGTPLAAILRYNAERGEYGPGDVEAQVAERLAQADTQVAHQFERVRPDGTVIEVRGKPLPGGGFVTTYTDITERKRAEHALQQAHDELERRVAERTERLSQALDHLKRTQDDLVQSAKLASLGSMVAGVSHELNTPIGNALMMASTLIHEAQGLNGAFEAGALKRSELASALGNIAEMAELLERSVKRAAALIASFKQVAVDQTSEQRRAFDLRTVIDDVICALLPGLDHPGLQINNAIPAGIHCDSFPGPLGQIVSNLILNAVTHAFVGRADPVIDVAALLQDGSVELTVSDNGVGMDAVTLAHVFDPFFTTQLGKGGSGLGLAICYRIANSVLSGELRATSSLGHSSSFILTMPTHTPGKL